MINYQKMLAVYHLVPFVHRDRLIVIRVSLTVYCETRRQRSATILFILNVNKGRIHKLYVTSF